jgi:hypothetical protein
MSEKSVFEFEIPRGVGGMVSISVYVNNGEDPRRCVGELHLDERRSEASLFRLLLRGAQQRVKQAGRPLIHIQDEGDDNANDPT